jgi:hypothetical protein
MLTIHTTVRIDASSGFSQKNGFSRKKPVGLACYSLLRAHFVGNAPDWVPNGPMLCR